MVLVIESYAQDGLENEPKDVTLKTLYYYALHQSKIGVGQERRSQLDISNLEEWSRFVV